ncbi:MAG: HWE histidine kinase domain-containing protein [Paracoccaceae bacterium]
MPVTATTTAMDDADTGSTLDRLRADEARHRQANLFALVRALLNASADRARSVQDLVSDPSGRLSALETSHMLSISERQAGADLREIGLAELAPFLGVASERFLSGPPVALGEQAGPLIALVLHEMTTNAVKYGALSVGNGTVWISWQRTPENGLQIDWTEENGPATGRPMTKGFGLRLIDACVRGHLGGTAEIDFREGGLSARLTIGATHVQFADAAPSEPSASPSDSPRSDPAPSRPLARLGALIGAGDPITALDYREMLTRLGARVVSVVDDIDDLSALAAPDLPNIALLDIDLDDGTVLSHLPGLLANGVLVVLATRPLSGTNLEDADGLIVVRKPVTEIALRTLLETAFAERGLRA